MNYLSIYLNAVNSDKLPSGWTRDVKFKLTVFNQANSNMSITRGIYFTLYFLSLITQFLF